MSGGLQHVVVMGVSGCGKSTTGQALAQELGWVFVEGDAFHPAANVAKMRAGTPLTDDDRWPWLRALADEIARHDRAGQSVVLGCSALRRSYRDVLRSGVARVRFLHVHGSRAQLIARLQGRKGHFFPPQLLDSQLQTLEMLQADEDGLMIDLGLGVDQQVLLARTWIETPESC